jgi:hypothetical protein
MDTTHEKVDLYTSDVGIEMKYGEDFEKKTFMLDLMQAIYELISLKNDGIIILKQFSFFNKSNAALIALYASMFNKFYICKPVTSRSINNRLFRIKNPSL